MKRINITQAAAVIGVAGLLGVASLATAGDKKPAAKPAAPAPAYTDPASLPKFAHVVVVTATPAQRAKAEADARQVGVGQKAYIDAQTGNFRQITPEDLAAGAAANPAASTDDSAPLTIVTASGGRALKLDESSHIYSVATVDANGKAKETCVGAQPNGKSALEAAKAAKIAQEDSHEK